MDIAEYKRRFGGRDDAAPGWDANDARLREVYGDQESRHWGSIKHMLGGPDPLDGISATSARTAAHPTSTSTPTATHRSTTTRRGLLRYCKCRHSGT